MTFGVEVCWWTAERTRVDEREGSVGLESLLGRSGPGVPAKPKSCITFQEQDRRLGLDSDWVCSTGYSTVVVPTTFIVAWARSIRNFPWRSQYCTVFYLSYFFQLAW